MQQRFHVEWHDRLESTNETLRARFMASGEPAENRLIVAREQTAGRGRLGRRWESAPGTNLCFSLLIPGKADPMAAPSLTMAAALAVTALLEARGIPAAPKWPNDVLVGNRKICGILSERVDRSREPRSGLIVGIGLNVNMTTLQARAIDQPATSMHIETEQSYDLIEILTALLPFLEHWIEQWEQGGFARLRPTWTQKAGPLGKPLAVHQGPDLITGTLAGFGDYGELWLRTANGVQTIWSGELLPSPPL